MPLDELLIDGIMAFLIDADVAQDLLTAALQNAEDSFQQGVPPADRLNLAVETERLFTSSTQAYREALVGCVVARVADERINIRHPATETSAESFFRAKLGRSGSDAFLATTCDSRVDIPLYRHFEAARVSFRKVLLVYRGMLKALMLLS